MLLAIILLTLGLAILIAGAEGLVRGAASLAKRFKVPPIAIGLTIVAFGTSTPELVVNIFSAIKGTTEIAVGNIIGSNIANLLLILGISAIIVSLKVQKATTWKEIPLALLAAALVYVMGNDILFDGGGANVLTRTDGLALIAFFLIFLYYTYGLSISIKHDGAGTTRQYSVALSVILILAGLAALVFGGSVLVEQAIVLARLAGLSEALIGLTIVAVGTSLPELATSVVAAVHKQDDIAVGNIVGSNIFNVFWILGITSIIRPLPIAPAMNFDIMVNIVATILLFAFMFIHGKHRLNRWQGALFILLYVSYVFAIVGRG